MDRYNDVKILLKKWEQSFFQTNNRKPNKVSWSIVYCCYVNVMLSLSIVFYFVMLCAQSYVFFLMLCFVFSCVV